MNKFFVLLLVGLCAAVFIFGHIHWKNMSEAAGIEGRKNQEKILAREKEEREVLIQRLKPENNNIQPLIDFLHYRVLTQGKVTVSVIGSNVTAGTGASNSSETWPELLKRKLQSENADLEHLQLMNHGFEGYSTSDLLKGKKFDLVIKEHPDLVIFEDSLINNHYQSISIDQTDKDLQTIMSIMQKGLPSAKILIISPNPIANSKSKNSLGLNYLDYISESTKIIQKNKWLYFDSVGGIDKKLKEENIVLADILANDYINPNNKGNFLWFEILYDYLKRK